MGDMATNIATNTATAQAAQTHATLSDAASASIAQIASAAGGVTAGASVQAQQTSGQTVAQSTTQPQELAEALMTALDARTNRVEAGIAKSMAEQYGMTADEVKQILEAEKAKRAAQLPPEQQALMQQRLAAADSRLLAAEVKAVGGQMGLVDAEAALVLMARDGIKISDDGNVSGVTEALTALKSAKAYLFSEPKAAPLYASGTGTAPVSTPYSPAEAALRAAAGLVTK